MFHCDLNSWLPSWTPEGRVTVRQWLWGWTPGCQQPPHRTSRLRSGPGMEAIALERKMQVILSLKTVTQYDFQVLVHFLRSHSTPWKRNFRGVVNKPGFISPNFRHRISCVSIWHSHLVSLQSGEKQLFIGCNSPTWLGLDDSLRMKWLAAHKCSFTLLANKVYSLDK